MSYFATNYTYILTHTMLPVPNSFENYMYIVFYEKNILFKNGVLLITLFYFVFIIFLFILCVWVFFLHVCLCTMCLPVAYRFQKRASDLLESELQLL